MGREAQKSTPWAGLGGPHLWQLPPLAISIPLKGPFPFLTH